jgi:hypothetical protein
MACRRVSERSISSKKRIIFQGLECRLAVIDIHAHDLRRLERRYRPMAVLCLFVRHEVSAAYRMAFDCQMIVQIVHGHFDRLQAI